jgi:hypothetical protein
MGSKTILLWFAYLFSPQNMAFISDEYERVKDLILPYSYETVYCISNLESIGWQADRPNIGRLGEVELIHNLHNGQVVLVSLSNRKTSSLLLYSLDLCVT